jgi:predicted N-acyltransferase
VSPTPRTSQIELSLRLLSSLHEVPAAAWNACVPETISSTAKVIDEDNGDNSSPHLSTRGFPDNPFLSHEFLCSLEISRSVGSRTGWQPRHLVIESAGEPIAVAPCYLKSHSRGEYVFDQGWAEAFERAGGDYYPKLQVAVPFTPVTGPRLLARPGPLQAAGRQALSQALVDVTDQNNLSSAHVTFATADESRLLGE